MKRRSAYYSRANSYSRSYNAHLAEEEGRFPRSRAAKALGLSLATFDAACEYAGISTNEWHHVGKYANCVDYWDTRECAATPAFWMGCARRAKVKTTRAAFVDKARAAQWDREALEEYGCGFRPTGKTPKVLAAKEARRLRADKLARLRNNLRPVPSVASRTSERFFYALESRMAAYGLTGANWHCVHEGFMEAWRKLTSARRTSGGYRSEKISLLSHAEMLNMLGQWASLQEQWRAEIFEHDLNRSRSHHEIRANSCQHHHAARQHDARREALVEALASSSTVQFTDAIGRHEVVGDTIRLYTARNEVVLTLAEFFAMGCNRDKAFKTLKK